MLLGFVITTVIESTDYTDFNAAIFYYFLDRQTIKFSVTSLLPMV